MFQGRSRGDLIGPWAPNVARRFGDAAVTRVRHRLPPPLAGIAGVLGADDWLPVGAQLLLTEAIADECLGGNLRGLQAPILEDTRAGLGRMRLLALRALGPGRAIAIAQRDFPKVHERGAVEVELGTHRALLVFRGTPLFLHPTWRLLQLYGLATLLELTGTPAGTVSGEELDGEGFAATACW
ncbi:MAG: hypothetical protein SFX73_14670 [Kofleriaceae bacterium]|nr:hypothetical protein [Kofleriaceae bacterium]